jgi:hypothetical protein
MLASPGSYSDIIFVLIYNLLVLFHLLLLLTARQLMPRKHLSLRLIVQFIILLLIHQNGLTTYMSNSSKLPLYAVQTV